MKDENKPDSVDGRLERAKDVALGAHHGQPSTADEIGEAAGGISGAVLGAGVGIATGPVGAVLGGIAGALGGWWAGRAVAEAAETLAEDDESYYRSHYESQADRAADRSYEDVCGAYMLGHIASQNPNFVAREFDDVEPELERGWAAGGERYATWATARSYAREAYTRQRNRRSQQTLANQITPTRPDESRE
jgi:hypothetical protein